MDDLGVLKNDVLALFPRVADMLPPGAGVENAKRLDAAERGLGEPGSVLVVLGQFDRGKSTLLNALLEEPDLLPPGAGAATRLVVTVRPAPVERILVRLTGPDQDREITRAELAGYVVETADVPAMDRARAAEVIVELPNEKLGEDLTVLDTPGTGSLFSGHAIATLGVLPAADAVLYVTDATQPLLASELAFIKQVAAALELDDHPGRLLFAVTKSDVGTGAAAAVEDLRTRLKDVPGAADAVIVPVSAKLRLDHLADGDPLDLELSNLPALESVLWSGVRRVRARLRLGTALNEVGAVVDGLVQALDSALGVAAALAEQNLQALAKAIEDAQEELAARSDAADKVPGEVAELLAAHAERIARDADNRLAQLWRELRTSYRVDGNLRDDPQRLLDLLASRLAVLTAELGVEADQAVTAVREEIAERFGYRVRAHLRRLLPAAPLPEPFAPAGAHYRPSPVEGIARAADAALRGAAFGGAAGARLGTTIWASGVMGSLPQGRAAAAGANAMTAAELIKALNAKPGEHEDPGAVLGRMVGTAVGATLAFVGELKNVQRAAEFERIAALDTFFATWEDDQRAFFAASLATLMDGHAASVGAQVRAFLERRREAARQTVARIEAARDGADLGPERADLEARREELLAVSREVDRLAAAAGFGAA